MRLSVPHLAVRVDLGQVSTDLLQLLGITAGNRPTHLSLWEGARGRTWGLAGDLVDPVARVWVPTAPLLPGPKCAPFCHSRAANTVLAHKRLDLKSGALMPCQYGTPLLGASHTTLATQYSRQRAGATPPQGTPCCQSCKSGAG